MPYALQRVDVTTDLVEGVSNTPLQRVDVTTDLVEGVSNTPLQRVDVTIDRNELRQSCDFGSSR